VDVDERVRIHSALADRHRLAIVDALALGDRTPGELAGMAGLPGNLLAHHLNALDHVGLIRRRVSDGDRRRRYISLRADRLGQLAPARPMELGMVLFVCTHNSARSQLAAALWRDRTSLPGDSAGREPAARVHPKAADVAGHAGLDLSGAIPRGYESVRRPPELVVSVCDRAHEAGVPFDAPTLHWSVPDPVADGRSAAFRSVLAELSSRIDRLAAAAAN
jgi:ArsR family transcriptional regulator, arsenate/arsenite/antimonite-responsive transcriptional repressor / arsenate reductase (thioredoxin)